MAPVLNNAIRKINSKREILLIIALLTFVNVYMGYIRACSFNRTGYTLVNFIYLYILSALIRKYDIKLRAKHLVTIIVLSIICNTLWAENLSLCAFFYNNPFVIITAFAITFLCKKITLKSKIVNEMASSVFAFF